MTLSFQESRTPFALRGCIVALCFGIGLAVYAAITTLMNRAFPNPWNAYFPPFVSYANSTNHGHLGAEYWNVAQSVVRGDGYSSPFGMESGPTAWVPPATVLLLALIHRLDGYNEMVTIRVYVTLNAMVFGFVAWQISGYVLS